MNILFTEKLKTKDLCNANKLICHPKEMQFEKELEAELMQFR